MVIAELFPTNRQYFYCMLILENQNHLGIAVQRHWHMPAIPRSGQVAHTSGWIASLLSQQRERGRFQELVPALTEEGCGGTSTEPSETGLRSHQAFRLFLSDTSAPSSVSLTRNLGVAGQFAVTALRVRAHTRTWSMLTKMSVTQYLGFYGPV